MPVVHGEEKQVRKLETGKGGWIRNAKVDFLKEGLQKGVLAVEIEMSGNADAGSFDDVAKLVQLLLTTELPKRRIVRFVGKLVDHDANFSLLVKSLFDYGFELQCVVPDAMVFSWLQWMTWVIIKTEQTVVMTASDEVWFHADETLPDDVTIPLRAQRPTFGFITGRVGVDEVDAFMCRSRHQWALL
jgi:hypothetical protein